MRRVAPQGSRRAQHRQGSPDRSRQGDQATPRRTRHLPTRPRPGDRLRPRLGIPHRERTHQPCLRNRRSDRTSPLMAHDPTRSPRRVHRDGGPKAARPATTLQSHRAVSHASRWHRHMHASQREADADSYQGFIETSGFPTELISASEACGTPASGRRIQSHPTAGAGRTSSAAFNSSTDW